MTKLYLINVSINQLRNFGNKYYNRGNADYNKRAQTRILKCAGQILRNLLYQLNE